MPYELAFKKKKKKIDCYVCCFIHEDDMKAGIFIHSLMSREKYKNKENTIKFIAIYFY